MRTLDSPVHLIHWSSHSSLQFLCDGSWGTSKWGPEDDSKTVDENVFVADDERLYTFEAEKATCEACKAKHDEALYV